jgi:two-component system response regulator HydG
MGAPLVGVQGALGYLYVEERRRAAPFAADDLDFLAALAELAGAALEQSQQHRRVLDWVEAHRRADAAAPILGDSPVMRQALDRVRRFAASGDTTVLVRGETGTGKELVARTLHALSPRAEAPFVAVNCAAIPETMIESELFGHERGAFTGADKARRGAFAVARGGTLFLDEIGDLALTAQAKVLRAIEEREVQPVGADHPVPIDLRIVAATHRPLEDEVAAGRFRADLFYRINVAEVELPPLRARGDDVVVLAEAFLRKGAARLGRIGVRLAPAALATLRRYDWPGNVRQLRNELERALLLADSAEIDLEDLRRRITLAAPPVGATGDKPLSAMETSERAVVAQALADAQGNVMAAAKALGVSRGTLYRKVEKYGLRADARNL